MRNLIVLLAAAGILFAATFAYAETTTGTIVEMDADSRTIVLDNEMAFLVPEEMAMPELEAGQQVEIEYQVTEEDGNLLDSIMVTE